MDFFRIERMPYSFADYFVLGGSKLQRAAPFLEANRQDYDHENLYVMTFTETYSCTCGFILDSARRCDRCGDVAATRRC